MFKFIICLLAPSIVTIPLEMLVMHDGEGHSFTAMIVDQWANGQVNRSINIACTEGCKKDVALNEKFDDEPLGIFRISDQNNILYITAVAGSSYKIRAYAITSDVISKVLDVSSLSAPEVKSSNDVEKVTITRRVNERSTTVMRQTLIWQGRGRFEIQG